MAHVPQRQEHSLLPSLILLSVIVAVLGAAALCGLATLTWIEQEKQKQTEYPLPYRR